VSTTTIDPPVIDPPLAQVLEDLSDEECALWAILQDPSGLDQAEFLWHDPDSPDG
jgi:hypothetical protein